jgi:formate hydrogenlyase subunit 6/NADH:ubiquinone oxidoreductase subunit I
MFCGRCIEACMWSAIVPGAGYKTAVEARKEAEQTESAEKAGKSKVYTYALSILVAAGSLLIAAVILSKINS